MNAFLRAVELRILAEREEFMTKQGLRKEERPVPMSRTAMHQQLYRRRQSVAASEAWVALLSGDAESATEHALVLSEQAFARLRARWMAARLGPWLIDDEAVVESQAAERRGGLRAGAHSARTEAADARARRYGAMTADGATPEEIRKACGWSEQEYTTAQRRFWKLRREGRVA